MTNVIIFPSGNPKRFDDLTSNIDCYFVYPRANNLLKYNVIAGNVDIVIYSAVTCIQK